jgi:hypothetical protein
MAFVREEKARRCKQDVMNVRRKKFLFPSIFIVAVSSISLPLSLSLSISILFAWIMARKFQIYIKQRYVTDREDAQDAE